ncbi:hypothetical protein Ait01nite_030510 [Actinoplanes italicus]|uniref:Uncharacterized protein n=1 Tax=Actinoplanes italicus TaxID=113567 RepID=A0A2T0KJ01_9ACTN|nr:hypothetical protein [Actinoplanes italicus]PRX23510.1 hypothetical protein CLV67_103258 [Actinoplanes italicus]GIE30006.1 hypothetical protein Ait01nite_030510 [Actinoplanes italicus]
MTATAVAAVLALVVALLRLRIHKREATRLRDARKHLLDRADKLRRELTIATGERDAAVELLDEANARIAKYDEGLRWRNELRQAAVERASYLMDKPHPKRTRRQRQDDIDRAAFESAWNARFEAPAFIPPHEQGDHQ